MTSHAEKADADAGAASIVTLGLRAVQLVPAAVAAVRVPIAVDAHPCSLPLASSEYSAKLGYRYEL